MPRRSGESSTRSSSSGTKRLEFGRVDIIPGKSPGGSGGISTSKGKDPPRMYKLRRSPTPLIGLDDLASLTKEHLAQLNSVWKEGDLPAFDADARKIAATFAGRDPFD